MPLTAKIRSMKQSARLAILAACLCLPGLADAAVAVVTNVKGTLSVLKADGATKILSQNSEIDAGDVLSTEKDSFARIKFTDGGEVAMRPASRIKVDKYGFTEETPQDDGFVFSLLKGGLRTATGLIGKRGNRDAYKLNTATATIGIRGTDYGALQCQADCEKLADGVYVNVNEGRVAVANDAGELELGAGEFGYSASRDKKPVLLEGDPGLPPFLDAFDYGIGDGQTAGNGCYIR